MRLGDIRNRFFFGGSSIERRFGIVLLLLVIGLGAFLRLSGSSWREAMPQRLEKTSERFEKEQRVFADEAEREHQLFKSLKREHFVKTGLYWAAMVNLILAIGLFFTRPLWCAEVGAEARVALQENGRAPPGRWFWIALAGALVFGTGLRLPRMDLSLYNDEAYNFRHYIHGQYKLDKNGEQVFHKVGWGETFFYNKANNGVPFSALAKLAEGDAAPDEVREWRLRLPALVPGLLSIAVLACLAAQLSGAFAGGAAAWFLALHPWHLRYCTEARPYGLVLLFAALVMWFLMRGLRGYRWRDWLGFGFSQFMLLWSFAGALYFALGLSIAALFAILRGGGGVRGVGRLAVAGIFGAMLYLQLMAPNFPQMVKVLGSVDSFHSEVDSVLVADIFSYLGSGMPAVDANPDSPISPALGKVFLPVAVLGVGALLALAVCGIGALRDSRGGMVLVWGNLLALVIALGASAASGGVLHRWYVIYLVPCVALLIGAGLARLWQAPRVRPLAAVLSLCVLAIFLYPLRCYIGHPKEDLRSIAAANAEDGAISAAFWSDAGIYDRHMRRVRSYDDLRKFMQEAEAAGRPLRVTFGHSRTAAKEFPECVRLLQSSGQFEKVADFPGLEEQQFTSSVFQWRGGEIE